MQLAQPGAVGSDAWRPPALSCGAPGPLARASPVVLREAREQHRAPSSVRRAAGAWARRCPSPSPRGFCEIGSGSRPRPSTAARARRRLWPLCRRPRSRRLQSRPRFSVSPSARRGSFFVSSIAQAKAARACPGPGDLGFAGARAVAGWGPAPIGVTRRPRAVGCRAPIVFHSGPGWLPLLCLRADADFGPSARMVVCAQGQLVGRWPQQASSQWRRALLSFCWRVRGASVVRFPLWVGPCVAVFPLARRQ
ncbi:unnamed protein product [Amoebophrya sp. A120]|nr:unnamed protein product [Amoebophrya sp. A120]